MKGIYSPFVMPENSVTVEPEYLPQKKLTVDLSSGSAQALFAPLTSCGDMELGDDDTLFLLDVNRDGPQADFCLQSINESYDYLLS